MKDQHTRNIHKIVMSESYNKRLEQKEKNNRRAIEEKGYSSELNIRGMKSYFEEIWGVFDKNSGEIIRVPLEEQTLPAVGPFEDITQTESFQNGRARGEFLANHGYTQELYLNTFLPDFEARINTQKKHR